MNHWTYGGNSITFTLRKYINYYNNVDPVEITESIHYNIGVLFQSKTF